MYIYLSSRSDYDQACPNIRKRYSWLFIFLNRVPNTIFLNLEGRKPTATMPRQATDSPLQRWQEEAVLMAENSACTKTKILLAIPSHQVVSGLSVLDNSKSSSGLQFKDAKYHFPSLPPPGQKQESAKQATVERAPTLTGRLACF